MRPSLAVLVMLLLSTALAGCTGPTAEEGDAPRQGSPAPGGGSATPAPATNAPSPTTPTVTGAGAPAVTPARVEVLTLAVDKGRVAPEERFTVTVTLRNLGGATGEGSVALRLDGDIVATREFSVRGSGLANLSFALESAQPGERTLDVTARGADVLARPITVDVVPAGRFSLRELVVTPTPIELGDLTTAGVTIVNEGATSATGTLRLTIEGETLATRNVDLAPGASERVTLELRPTQGGNLTVVVAIPSAGVSTSGDLRVRAPKLENPGGAFNNGMCDTYLGYTLSFDNSGDGVARRVNVTAIVTREDGTEHSRYHAPVQDVLAKRRADIPVAPPITQRCGAEDVYHLRFVVTTPLGAGFEWDAGRFVV